MGVKIFASMTRRYHIQPSQLRFIAAQMVTLVKFWIGFSEEHKKSYYVSKFNHGYNWNSSFSVGIIDNTDFMKEVFYNKPCRKIMNVLHSHSKSRYSNFTMTQELLVKWYQRHLFENQMNHYRFALASLKNFISNFFDLMLP